MNIQQLNNAVAITDFLAGQGIQPASKRKEDWWYISPIRAPERTPSFKVSTRLNRWYDHGTGEGGKLFDLAVRLLPGASIRELIQLLSGPVRSTKMGFIPPAKLSPQVLLPRESKVTGQAPTSGLRVLETKPLQTGRPLAVYLEQRGITLDAASPYCCEARFSVGGRQYQAIGFANRSGGHELRNAWFKGSSSPKDITFLDRGSNTVCLLEGFMDFLSLLQLRPRLVRRASFLVLNSLSQLAKSQEVLARHRQVLLFLDQDPAGRRVTARLLHAHPSARDCSSFYRGHQDVNAYLVARGGQVRQLRLGLRHG